MQGQVGAAEYTFDTPLCQFPAESDGVVDTGIENRQSLFLSILTKLVDDHGTGTAVDFVPKQEEVLNA